MVFHGKCKSWDSAPLLDLEVVFFVFADGYRFIGQIRNACHKIGNLRLQNSKAICTRLHVTIDLDSLSHFCSSILAFGFFHANGFGELIAFGLQLFRAGLQLLALCL